MATPFDDLLEISLNDKKGLTFFLAGGQAVGGRVTRRVADDVVELSSQEYRRIVLRLEHVAAVAML